MADWGTEQSDEESWRAKLGFKFRLHQCGIWIRNKGEEMPLVAEAGLQGEEYLVEDSMRERDKGFKVELIINHNY